MLFFKKILEEGIRTRAFPGAVLVVGDNNGIIFEEAAEVRPDTIYDLASLTKVVVTTTLAMRLFEKGRLDLDVPPDELEEYSIRQLLTHSAGLPAEASVEIVDGRRPQLQYEPGTRVLYSDLGFIILGKIIERIGGAPLDVLAREWIFEPLGMKDTCFNPSPALFDRIAPTGTTNRGHVHDRTAAAMGGVAGHAGLFSTAQDLAIFCRMMLRGGDTIALFTRLDGRVTGSTRALGWDTPSQEGSSSGRYFSRESFGHTGFTGTSMWIDPTRKVYIVLLTNRIYPGSDNLEIREIRPKVHDAVMLSLIEAAPGNIKQ